MSALNKLIDVAEGKWTFIPQDEVAAAKAELSSLRTALEEAKAQIPCSLCDGTGHRKSAQATCCFCDGTGWKYPAARAEQGKTQPAQ